MEKKTMTKEENEIELRSEEVQELMGQMPPWLMQWGITIIGIWLVFILVGCYFFKYPDTLQAKIVINSAEPPVGFASMPANGTGKLEIGQEVRVRLDNYPDTEFGFVTGVVDSISVTPDEMGLYHLAIAFPDGMKTNYNKILPLKIQLAGSADIVIKDKRLIENFIQPIKKLLSE